MEAVSSYASSGGWADRWGGRCPIHRKAKTSYLGTFTDGDEIAVDNAHKVWGRQRSAHSATLPPPPFFP